METVISKITIDVVSVKINGKKLTNGFLAQIPFIDASAWVDEHLDIEQELLSNYQYRTICQLDKMSLLKHYKERIKVEETNQLLRDDHSHINARVSRFFEGVEMMLLWETPHGQLAFHRLYKDAILMPTSLRYRHFEGVPIHDIWANELESFSEAGYQSPVAMVGL